eukprot:6196489-Pleurochrysis_carterae.AAC.6
MLATGARKKGKPSRTARLRHLEQPAAQRRHWRHAYLLWRGRRKTWQHEWHWRVRVRRLAWRAWQLARGERQQHESVSEAAAIAREQAAAKQEALLKDSVQNALSMQAAAEEKEGNVSKMQASLQDKIDEAASKVAEMAAERNAHRTRADAAEEALRVSFLQKRGRKSGHAGRARVEERWDWMGKDARRKARMLRHTRDIADHFEEAAVDWEPTAFASALDSWLELIQDLLSTRPFVMARMEFAKELAELLQAEWNISLAFYLNTELGLSDTNYQRLRLAMRKEHNGGR